MLHLALEEHYQRWSVLLFVAMVPKQAVQVSTSSHHIFSLGRITNAHFSCLKVFVGAFEKYRDPDIHTKIFSSTDLTCDKNYELLFDQHFWEQAGVGQHIAQVWAILETSQTWLVQFKSPSSQHGISGVQA